MVSRETENDVSVSAVTVQDILTDRVGNDGIEVQTLIEQLRGKPINVNSISLNKRIPYKVKVDMKPVGPANADMIDRENWTSPKYVLSINHPKPNISSS